MTRSTGKRRASAIVLVVLGAVVMLLAPQVWPGGLLLAAGIVLELVGIALEHKSN